METRREALRPPLDSGALLPVLDACQLARGSPLTETPGKLA
jgi:hypothetical protein